MLMAGPDGAGLPTSVPVQAELLPLLDHRLAWAPTWSAACSPLQLLLRAGGISEVVHTRALCHDRGWTS